jgi:hypothetical protein
MLGLGTDKTRQDERMHERVVPEGTSICCHTCYRGCKKDHGENLFLRKLSEIWPDTGEHDQTFVFRDSRGSHVTCVSERVRVSSMTQAWRKEDWQKDKPNVVHGH